MWALPLKRNRTDNFNIVTMNKPLSTQPTFESIMAILDRTAKRQEAFEKLQEKNAIEAKEQRKKDVAEAKERSREYEEQRKKDAAEAKERNREYDEQRKKASAEYEEQRKKIAAEAAVRMKNIEEAVGGISNNNGYLAEEYFFNALDATRKLGNIKFDFIERNRERHIDKVQDEFDIVMYNGSSVAIIEVKYRARQNSLQHLTTKKVQNFRTLYPEYADHKLYLGIASMSFNEEVINKARKLGIGILKQKGDTIECDTENMKAY
ncbi:hypothetical protein FACS1894199_11260 [Bacteroidia bacterium]|nr:hypothetical protein FACS1894199_11260 [Bacteroidia bacterium]